MSRDSVLTALPRCCSRKCRNLDSCNIEFRDIIVINNKVKRNEIVLKQKIEVHILLLHDEVGN